MPVGPYASGFGLMTLSYASCFRLIGSRADLAMESVEDNGLYLAINRASWPRYGGADSDMGSFQPSCISKSSVEKADMSILTARVLCAKKLALVIPDDSNRSHHVAAQKSLL